MMETITRQFAFAQYIAMTALEGITQEESMKRPEPGGNSVNWVLGHIVNSRSRMLILAGQPPLISEQTAAAYARGSSGTDAAETTAALTDLYKRSQDLITDALLKLSDEDLAKPAPFGPPPGPDTVGSLIAKLAMHESYHVGQLGMLRRQAGKERFA